MKDLIKVAGLLGWQIRNMREWDDVPEGIVRYELLQLYPPAGEPFVFYLEDTSSEDDLDVMSFTQRLCDYARRFDRNECALSLIQKALASESIPNAEECTAKAHVIHCDIRMLAEDLFKYVDQRERDSGIIRHIAYDFYQRDWIAIHVTHENMMSVLRKFYVKHWDDSCYTFDEYVDENGYDAAHPACFEEFLEHEYRNRDYMLCLLADPFLTAKYLKDIDSKNQ